MAKRIKLFSSLSPSKKTLVSNMIENGELQFINVNSSADSKKGVIVTLDDDEFLIIMDTIRKIKHKEFEDDDDDAETSNDAEIDTEAEIDDELVIEEADEVEEADDVADVDDGEDGDDGEDDEDDLDKEEID